MRIGWLAYDPAECPNIQHGVLKKGAETVNTGRCKFQKEFATQSAVFAAIKHYDAGSNRNLRLYTQFRDVKEDRFDYKNGTWATGDDHALLDFTYIWIAVA